jgi:Uma2 family endonuclease
MRAVVLEVPRRWLDERARLGLDRYDEMWEGVLHMTPAPGFAHQRMGSKLHAFLEPILAAAGIEVLYETEVHRPGAGGTDYRIPDMVFFHAERTDLQTPRGLVGAPLAVLEIRSPEDETYEKLDFWASLGVPEVIVLDPETKTAEVFRLVGKRYLVAGADERGRLHVRSLDVWFSMAAGERPLLRVEAGGLSREI